MTSVATLQQVARHVGVSRQTVSNALKAPERLSPATLERVQGAMDELGYRPDARALALPARPSGLIGYAVAPTRPGSVNVFMDRFLQSVTAEVEASGRHVLLFTAPPGEAGLNAYGDLLARSAVDGFILTHTTAGDLRPEWLHARGVPFASFGRPWSESPQHGPWVDVDGAAGTFAAVEHLVALGHRRIGLLGLPKGNPVGDDRAQGWARACEQLGADTDPALAVRSANEHLDRGDAARKLLDLDIPPTALVAVNDAMALGAYAALAARGLVPGRDIALTGFDDSPTAAAVLPGLTSVRQPVGEVARRLVQFIEEPLSASKLLKPRLIVRGSTLTGTRK